MGRISESDADLLAQKFAEKLQQSRSVSDSVHFDHHAWIAKRIEAEEERKKFYETLGERLAEKSMWGLLVVLGLLLWHGVEVIIRRVAGSG